MFDLYNKNAATLVVFDLRTDKAEKEFSTLEEALPYMIRRNTFLGLRTKLEGTFLAVNYSRECAVVHPCLWCESDAAILSDKNPICGVRLVNSNFAQLWAVHRVDSGCMARIPFSAI